VGEFILKT